MTDVTDVDALEQLLDGARTQQTFSVQYHAHPHSKNISADSLFCAGALDEFDSEVVEQRGAAAPACASTACASAGEAPNQPDGIGVLNCDSVSSAAKKAPKFNPLGRKPKKQKHPNVPPQAIKDIKDVSEEELEASAKEISAMLQNMMKGAGLVSSVLPQTALSGVTAAPDT